MGDGSLDIDPRQHVQSSGPSSRQIDSLNAIGNVYGRSPLGSGNFSDTLEPSRTSIPRVQASTLAEGEPSQHQPPTRYEDTPMNVGEISSRNSKGFESIPISGKNLYSSSISKLHSRPSHGTLVQDRERIGPTNISAEVQRGYPNPSLNGIGRRRSRSIGSGARDSRIAALSVQLRARLSYAAAKVEKKRQSHSTQHPSSVGILHRNALTQRPTIDALARIEEPSSLAQEMERQRFTANYSPNGTTVSAPDPPATSGLSALDTSMRLSPLARSDSLSQPSALPDSQSLLSGAPKLAPPVDIVPSSGSDQRRRPSPNEPIEPTRYAPLSRHRRHHSQLEFGWAKSASASEVVLIPETPPLKPSLCSTTSTLSDKLDHSQNSSMEQDAIETLLFMSSPGNSGYHSNSQHSQRQQNSVRAENNATQSANNSAPWGIKSPGSIKDGQTATHNRSMGLEAHAGDEIDRMLDQMDSDSDDEKNSKATRFSNTPTEPSQSTS